MKLTEIADKNLLQATLRFVREERDITLVVLQHLREIERRSLYATIGYSSLFEYAVTELKYSEGAAQRRISSMRLLRALPEIERKIESGALSLTSLAKAQSFFKQEKIESAVQKTELLAVLEGKSAREVDREMLLRSSMPERRVVEKMKEVSKTHAELKCLVEVAVLRQIEELRGLLAHSHPNAQLKDLVTYAIGVAVEGKRPKLPKAQVKIVEPIMKSSGRYIGREVQRQVWERDQGGCTFTHGGRQCSSRHGLEIDHVEPFAVGGSHELENLRLRCRAHNQLAAVAVFGQPKMARHIPRMK